MKLLVATCICFLPVFGFAEECIPKKRFLPVPAGDSIGRYLRIHPSGNFVLSSVSGKVVIFDLTKNPIVQIETPANDETYPVEGSWRFLASPNHDPSTMHYYSFNDVLKNQREARPQISDSSHNEFYHSAAELPKSSDSQIHFRTVLYRNLVYRDYSASLDSSGNVVSHTKGRSDILCPAILESHQVVSSEVRAETKDQMRKIESQRASLVSEIMVKERLYNETRDVGLRKSYENDLRALQLELQGREADLVALRKRLGLSGVGSVDLSEPILSKNGRFVAGSTHGPNGMTMQIFKIEEDHCTRVADTKFSTSKVSFAYSDNDDHQRIAFTGSNLIPNQPLPVSTLSDQELADLMRRNRNIRDFVRSARSRNVRGENAIRIAVEEEYLGRVYADAYVFDSRTGVTQRLTGQRESPSYPGFTRDGRLIYGGVKDNVLGFFIVDPNQIEGGSGKCITSADVTSAGGLGAATAEVQR